MGESVTRTAQWAGPPGRAVDGRGGEGVRGVSKAGARRLKRRASDSDGCLGDRD